MKTSGVNLSNVARYQVRSRSDSWIFQSGSTNRSIDESIYTSTRSHSFTQGAWGRRSVPLRGVWGETPQFRVFAQI